MSTSQEDAKQRLVAAYLAMEPAHVIVKLVREAGGGLLSRDMQVFFYENCLNNRVCEMFPRSELYVKRVLKQLILTTESEKEEVLTELYEQYALFLIPSMEEMKAVERCYKSYLYSLPDNAISKLAAYIGERRTSKFKNMLVTVRVSLNMLGGGTGFCTWPAGMFLSEFILTHPHIFSSKCCLELGSGTGLSGICLAQLNPAKVILTDGNLSTLANLKHNLLINGISVLGEVSEATDQNQLQMLAPVQCQGLSWEAAIEDDFADFDAHVIIGADLIYDPRFIPHLIRVLTQLLLKNVSLPACQTQLNGMNSMSEKRYKEEGRNLKHSNGSSCADAVISPVAFLATAIRNLETLYLFLSLAHKSGLVVQDVTQAMQPIACLPALSDYDRSSICLHKLTIQ
eukprot:c43620_g1_i1 orf=199-1395(-)